MVEIVNLRMARKRKQRDDAKSLAAEKRLIHGRSKLERLTTSAERRAEQRLLDGHKLDAKDET